MTGNETLELGVRGYRLDDWVLIPNRGKRFSLLCSIQTGSETHTASCPMGTGVKQPGHEADHSCSSSAKVDNGGAIPPLHTSSWHGAQLIKPRENFTFYLYLGMRILIT
jgi:hypothetical protein